MDSGPNILIIGAGLIGLSVADHLTTRGAAVTLVDARSGAGRGTSYSNSGMIHPSQARPWDFTGAQALEDAAFKAVHDLAEKSKHLLEDKLNAMNLWARRDISGCYKIYPDMNTARFAQERYANDGIMSRVVMDVGATLGHIALYFENDISANAYSYCKALEAELHERGATFIFSAENLRLRRSDEGVTAGLEGHIFKADHVIICAGPQSADILSKLGMSLSIKKLRGFAVNFDRPDIELPPAPLMDSQSRSAMTIFDNHIRFSGTVGQDSARPLLKRWFELAPNIMGSLQPATEIWSGLRPMSKAGRPYIGPTDIPNLWVNTGHGHMGWTLSAGSGELMARMIMDGETDERFALVV